VVLVGWISEALIFDLYLEKGRLWVPFFVCEPAFEPYKGRNALVAPPTGLMIGGFCWL